MEDIYTLKAKEFAFAYNALDPNELHSNWKHLIDSQQGLCLDIGAGSGRDANWLANMGHEVFAIEPSPGMRKLGMEKYKNPKIHWMNDSLPDLKKLFQLNLKFNLILINAVWMHIPKSKRARTLRKIGSLLAPGGIVVITLRDGPCNDGRTMYEVTEEELSILARQNTLETLLINKHPDQMNRKEVSWKTVVLRLPDDGTGALLLLRHIIINDNKSSTYKLALLRVLIRIADGAYGSVLEKTEKEVIIPFGLVGLYWVKAFYPLLLKSNLRQMPGKERYGFAKEAFNSIKDYSKTDFELETHYKGNQAKIIRQAIKDARDTIKKMPAFYITYPGKSGDNNQIFHCISNRMSKKPEEFYLNIDFLSSFGSFSIPKQIWDTMHRYACWLEPAIVEEWIRLMQKFDQNAKIERPLQEYYDGLKWEDPKRTTAMVREKVYKILEQKPIYCIWSGKKLNKDIQIDHMFPFARWKNNDLWNLLPTHPSINLKKSDKLPSAALLANSKERIEEWWQTAWLQTNYEKSRFFNEAELSLPLIQPTNQIQTPKEQSPTIQTIFHGVELQRIRLRSNQMLGEWG
jgi:SAM-dependent methyltransferase